MSKITLLKQYKEERIEMVWAFEENGSEGT